MKPDVAIVVGLLALAGVMFTAFLAWRSNRANASNAFMTNVLSRLKTVEEQLEELESKLTSSQRATAAAVRYIDRLIRWGRNGGRGKMPLPSAELHEHLDPTIWDESTE